MRDYIYGLVNRVPSLFRPAVRFVVDVIFAVWDDAYRAMSLIAAAWPQLRNGITFLANAIYYTLENAYKALRWVITVKIPSVVNSAVDALSRWASQAIDAVSRGLTILIDGIHRVLDAAINTLSDWARRAVDLLTRTLNDAIRILNDVAKRVWQLLTDPEKFAEWAIGAIWRAFWRYALDNASRIAAAAWRQRTEIGLKGLSLVESILARIL